jgi:hypothetical protein
MPWFLVGALGTGVALALLRPSASDASADSGAHATRDLPPLPAPAADEGDPADPHAGLAAEGTAAAQGEPSSVPETTLEGTVKEHIDVSQYTYVRLATDAGDSWAAVYRAPVKDGARVRIENAAKMTAFHSRELNRDFDAIWFGSLASR